MRSVASFFQNHYLALILAFLVGVVLVSPQLYLLFDLGKAYHGVYLSGVDGHVYYPRIQEIYEGNYKATSPAVFEYKNQPYAFPPLPEITVAGLAKLFSLNVSQAIIFSSFLFPFLLCLIFYFLFLKITHSKFIALTSAVAIILLSNFVFFPRNLLNLVLRPSAVTLIPYNRPIHPQVSSVYFYFWLLLFWLSLQEAKKRYTILAGLIFGLLFYVYPFAWMFAFSLQGMVFLYFLVTKNFAKAKQIFTAAALGFGISVFYWLNFYRLVTHPLYQALQQHNGFYHSREPVWGWLLFLDLIFLVFLYRLRGRDNVFVLCAAAIATSIVLTNQQILTNFRFFPGHWYWYYITPFSIFLVIFTLFSWLRGRSRLSYLFAAAIIGLAFLSGAISQRNYYRAEKPNAVSEQRYGEVFAWFEKNTKPQSVVLADDPFALLLPAYTSNNHYLADVRDVLSIIPEERLRHDFFVKIYLAGARTNNLDQYINPKTPDFIQLLYGYYRRYAYGCDGPKCYAPEEIETLKQEYREFLKTDFESELKKYRIDYLVIDQTSNHWNYQDLTFLKLITVINGFLIFQVN